MNSCHFEEVEMPETTKRIDGFLFIGYISANHTNGFADLKINKEKID